MRSRPHQTPHISDAEFREWMRENLPSSAPPRPRRFAVGMAPPLPARPGSGSNIGQPGAYLIECMGLYKIGITASLSQRVSEFRQQMPGEVTMVHKMPRRTPQEARAMEKNLHREYQTKRAHGEWFDLSQSDVQNIKRKK